MLRLLQGFGRSLRNRNQVPPNHTTKWSEDTENSTENIEIPAGISVENYEECNHTTSIALRSGASHQIRRNHTSCQDIQISKRTFILHNGSFGPSSGKDYGSEGDYSGARSYEPYIDGILSGIGMSTMWMTVFFFGRLYLTYDQKPNRKEIFLTWKENLKDSYSRVGNFNDSWRNVLQIDKFRFPYNAAVLAAGGEDVRAIYMPMLSPPRIVEVGLAGSVSQEKDIPDTSRQRSVTFDKKIKSDTITPPGSSSYSSQADDDSLFSEELLEEFERTNRQCAGATFNILGLQQVYSKNHDQAFNYFKCGSSEVYGKSLYNLAICYQEGLGTVKDLTKAMRLYEKASYCNHPLAQYNLAQLLLRRGNAADVMEALRLLEKSASNGLTKAMVALGVYLTEPGPNQNYKKSVKMFEKASEQGDTEAKYFLGICYEHGLGNLRKDVSAAYDLYSSASSSGHLNARYNSAAILESGCPGVDINSNMATQLYLSASKLGHRESASRLKELRKENKKMRCDHATTGKGQDNSNTSFTILYTEGKTKSCPQLQLHSSKYDHVVCFEKNS